MSEMDEKKKGPEKKDQEPEESDLEAVRGFVQRHVWATLGSVFVVTFLLAVAITLVCVNKEQVYQNGVAAGQSMADESYASLCSIRESNFLSRMNELEYEYTEEMADRQEEYEAGLVSEYERGYAAAQSEASAAISQLESQVAKYEAQGASSAEPQISESSSAGAADLKPVGATVYWTPNGSSYHSTQNCPSLSRSKNIESGTVTQAINSGHGNPCSRCH